MASFKIYHEEYLKHLIPSFGMLKSCNIIFCGTELSSWQRYWRFLYMVPLQLLHYISLSAYIENLFTKTINPFEKPDMIPIWLVSTEYWFKCANLLINREEIREIIAHIGSTWRTNDLNEEQINMKNAALKYLYYGDIVPNDNTANLLSLGIDMTVATIYFVSLMLAGNARVMPLVFQMFINTFNKLGLTVGWLYLLIPLFETVFRQLILDQNSGLLLPFACVYPFETNTWPVYLMVYAVQVYCTLCVAYVYLGAGWLIVVLTSHLVVLFNLLQEDLIHVKPTKNQTLDEDKETVFANRSNLCIEDFIKRHQNAISLADKLNSCCNKLTFTTMLFATLIICFFAVAGKASSGADSVKNYGAIMVVLVNIFILCYYSQLLSSSSSGIALAAAKNLWYKGDTGFRSSILFIIMRSQKPCSLTSLNVSPISLQTFNTVLKTTWSYFSLANQMYDESD